MFLSTMLVYKKSIVPDCKQVFSAAGLHVCVTALLLFCWTIMKLPLSTSDVRIRRSCLIWLFCICSCTCVPHLGTHEGSWDYLQLLCVAKVILGNLTYCQIIV